MNSRPSLRRAVLVSALLALLTACEKAPPAHENIRPVRTVQVGIQAQPTEQRFAGEIRARREARLAFRVGGKIVERAVELGQPVRAGQVLLRLDPQDTALQLTAARSQWAATQVQAQEARLALERSSKMLAQGFVSQAELDRRQSAFDAAVATQTAAESSVRLLAHQQDYTVLRADHAGVLMALEAEVGQVVAAGTPVATLALDGEREVLIAVPEANLAGLQTAQRLDISLWAQPGSVYRGRLREVAASADPHTRTYAARVSLDQPATALRLGMTASVLAVQAATARSALTLPLSALLRQGGQDGVWVVDRATSTVKRYPVVIGALQGERAEITRGLVGGETVVTAGVHLLHEGQKVRLAESALARR